MEKIILNFPKQFRIGIESSRDLKIAKNFTKVCICGMGGSALPANLLFTLGQEYKLNLNLAIQRDYSLPFFVDKKTLIVCISYSGNTEETLFCAKEAIKKQLKLVFISSDGKLEKIAKKYNLFLAKVPSGLPPRMALGYQLGALIGILKKANLIKESFLKEFVLLEEKLNPISFKKMGKELAKKLKNKIPLIYASNKTKILARIWKIKFNENTKIPAFWNYFPELNHNEMVGFTNKINKNFFLVILQDKDDHPRNKKRMKLTLDILKKYGINGEIIKVKGKSFLERMFNSILLSDWTSFYLAKIYQIDPLPVKMVEEFKQKMKK